MPLLELDRSVLVVVDVQPSFLGGIVESERVVARCAFLIECARTLGVPILATEQVPERMGGTHPELVALMPDVVPIGKQAFGCVGCAHFDAQLAATGRDQVVLCGIETHICVTQTALALAPSHRAFLAVDAASARSVLAHELGVRRIGTHGELTHSESVVYEWMRTAAHPRFRDVLPIVKRYA